VFREVAEANITPITRRALDQILRLLGVLPQSGQDQRRICVSFFHLCVFLLSTLLIFLFFNLSVRHLYCFISLFHISLILVIGQIILLPLSQKRYLHLSAHFSVFPDLCNSCFTSFSFCICGSNFLRLVLKCK